MRRVLVATDLSLAADLAIREAHSWASMLEAELVVCHVQPVLGDVGAAPGDVAAALAERVHALTARSAALLQIEVPRGNPATVIARRAAEWAADLVVVGAQETSGVLGALLGGVAAQVIRHARAAVLVARATEPSGHVLAATDLSDPTFPAVATGAEASRRLCAGLTVLHCLDEPAAWGAGEVGGGMAYPEWPTETRAAREAEAHARLRTSLGRVNAVGRTAVRFGAPSVEILNHALELPAELVVVGTTGRSGVRRLLLGSTAEAVLRSARCSVLVERLRSASRVASS